MARLKRSLARQYVDNWLEHLAGDVGHTPAAKLGWSRAGLQYADVIRALEVGHVTHTTKEEAHDAIFEITGEGIDGETLCVTISIEPIVNGITILNVTVLTEQDNDHLNDPRSRA